MQYKYLSVQGDNDINDINTHLTDGWEPVRELAPNNVGDRKSIFMVVLLRKPDKPESTGKIGYQHA